MLITVTAANDLLTAPTSPHPAGPPLRLCRRTTAVTLALFWISRRLRWPRWILRCLRFRLAIASGTCCWETRHFRTMTGNVNKICVLWYLSCWLGIILKGFVFVWAHIWLERVLNIQIYFLFHSRMAANILQFVVQFLVLFALIRNCKWNQLSGGFMWWQSCRSQGCVAFWAVLLYFTLSVCVSNEWHLSGFFWVFPFEKETESKKDYWWSDLSLEMRKIKQIKNGSRADIWRHYLIWAVQEKPFASVLSDAAVCRSLEHFGVS